MLKLYEYDLYPQLSGMKKEEQFSDKFGVCVYVCVCMFEYMSACGHWAEKVVRYICAERRCLPFAGILVVA